MDDANSHAVNGADLALLDISENEAVMEVRDNFGNVLKHPDGRSFTITLYSRDSDKFVELARKLQDARMQQSLRTRMPTFAVVSDRDTVELLVAATKSWDIVLNGEVPPSTPDAYRAAYTKIRRLREQVDEFLGNAANFTTG